MNVKPGATHYLYPLNPKSSKEYHFIDDHGAEHPTSLEGFLDCHRGAKTATWAVAYNGPAIKNDDIIWVHFSAPLSAIMAVGVVTARSKDKSHELTIKWDWTLTDALQMSPIPFNAHMQRPNYSVTRANDKTTAVLESWLGKSTRRGTRKSVPVKFRPVEIDQRLGQTEFRNLLLAAYGQRCAVSGCRTRDVLQAAHITPVKMGGNHDISNGIILRADLHNLFDKGLLVFDSNGKVLIHPSVKDSGYRQLHGRSCQQVVQLASRSALASHRRSHGSRWNPKQEPTA